MNTENNCLISSELFKNSIYLCDKIFQNSMKEVIANLNFIH